MMAPDSVARAIVSSIDGMQAFGPESMLLEVNSKLQRIGENLTESELIECLVTGDPNALEQTKAHIALARWDAEPTAAWVGATEPGTVERRTLVLQLLGLAEASWAQVNARYPRDLQSDIVIAISDQWDPWYTDERRKARDFYWSAYRRHLEERGKMDPASLAALDASSTNIVGRLADPTRADAYQSKGLVVGHVQSGKTANFTGVIAKAIDSGYRLIIVLTGTVELLREQTQRRLDMELAGEENILGGIDRNDPDATRDLDYIGTDDQDWFDGKFLKLGVPVNEMDDIPAIRRLTSLKWDYKRLRHGLDALDFRSGNELADRQKRLYDPVNLFRSNVRIAVVKKNKTVLEKLNRDLQDIHANLGEIPALIIDDEADQASVNTTNPGNRGADADAIERTAINRLIAQLLKHLKRAQYVGYTATPFANVFVSPADAEDIFPRDFIIDLAPSPDYMGGAKFHDLDGLPPGSEGDPAVSNEAAFVRGLVANSDVQERTELLNALDAFVLTGAIKLWRAEQDAGLAGAFRHHTMLVHESVRQADHKVLAELIRAVWSEAAYTTPKAFARIRELYETDFERVHLAREWGTLMPSSFEQLRSFLGNAVTKILAANDPVVIVNGSKDSDYSAMDFQTAPMWRILVGGTKLSRGFTVEGLTITYYKRRALAADTLMQMGRWFGYRPGYGDLVRLFIARNITDRRGNTYDLYDTFESIVHDEEDFREQLQKFSLIMEDGRPAVRPIHVPPLVFQELPWLSPTQRSKMYNAELAFQGQGARLRDFPMQPPRGLGEVNARHVALVSPILARLTAMQSFEYEDKPLLAVSGTTRTFDARVAIATAEEVLQALSEFVWMDNFRFEPFASFMQMAMAEGTLTDWAVVVPYLTTSTEHQVGETTLPLFNRKRRVDRGGFSGSSFRQRDAITHIAGGEKRGGPNAEALHTPTRGAVLLTFAADPAKGAERDHRRFPPRVRPEDVATVFSLAFPALAAPRGRIGFRVKDPNRMDAPVVDLR